MHTPRSRFGQNFLINPHIIDDIVRAIHPQAGERLIEIGPGLGALTVPVLRLAGQLTAIELDRDLIPLLKAATLDLGRLEIIQQDVLSVDFKALQIDDQPLRVYGNLPYNISTPLIFHLLQYGPLIQEMFFMLQKEVVDRMVAQPGSKTYGRLSVMVQAQCQVDQVLFVPPTAFKPAPKVDSAVVRLQPYPCLPYPINDYARFAQVVTAAFNQRRKTLRNALSEHISAERLTAMGIDPTLRAENVSVEDFIKLGNL